MVSAGWHYIQAGRRQHWSAEQRARRQSWLFRKLAAQAFEQVPFYRELWTAAGLRPSDLQEIEDLRKLPVITKGQVRQAGASIRADGGRESRGVLSVATSGSTGIPLSIAYSPAEEARRRARYEQALHRVGGRLWHRRLRVGGFHPPGLRLWDVLPRTWKPVIHTSVDAAVDRALWYRPHMIRGLVSQLELMADQVAARQAHFDRLRLVVCGGEMLTPIVKRRLEEAFQVPVRSIYASWEFGAIAAACPDSECFHLTGDDLIVECLENGRPVPPGRLGKAVITGLTSRLMPFIRYDLGDQIALGPPICGCGSPFPTITALQGRLDDFLIGTDGRLVSPYAVVNPMVIHPGIRQFRVIQETRTSARVEFTAEADLTEQERSGILRLFEQVLPGVAVGIVRCAEIQPDPSGKLRKVLSLTERF